ncbi:MAG: sugar phosphate nucleotidyltransferase [Planctomycetota bacterium]|jgi:glucose-1-phosphate cytidylyltransferase
MKTVILCGGKGRRLDRETEYRPKPLVEVGGRPILWHIMKIYSHQGFKDFILCLGYKGNMIKKYFLSLEEMSNDFLLDLRNKQKMSLSSNDALDGRVYFIDTGYDTMTGARIAKIKKYIGEDGDFFITYGDGVADIDLHKLYQYHKKMAKIATITSVSPVYWFGLVESEDGLVTKFDEKPNMKDLINGGFMVFNRKIFDYLSEKEGCVLELEPLRKLAQDGQLATYQHKGFWKCMDNQKDVDELNKVYKQGAPWEIWKNE